MAGFQLDGKVNTAEITKQIEKAIALAKTKLTIGLDTTAALKSLSELTGKIKELEKPIKLSFNTAEATKQLDAIQSQISQIKKDAGTINVKVGASSTTGTSGSKRSRPTISDSEQIAKDLAKSAAELDRNNQKIIKAGEQLAREAAKNAAAAAKASDDTAKAQIKAAADAKKATAADTKAQEKIINDAHARAIRDNKDFNKAIKDANAKAAADQLALQKKVQAEQNRLNQGEFGPPRAPFDAQRASQAQRFTQIAGSTGVNTSAINDATASFTKFSEAMGKTAKAASGVTSSLGGPLAQQLGLTNGLVDALASNFVLSAIRLTAFAAAGTLLFGFGRAVQSVSDTIVTFEQSLVNLNKVFNISLPAIQQVGKELLTLSINTGTAFNDVANAAIIFAQQGLSAAQTLEATNAALLAVNASGISVNDAIELITVSVNSFKKSFDDAGKVVEPLSFIADKTAASVQDLSIILQRSGASSEAAGISLEKLAAIGAKLREGTRLSAETVGSSLKTIFVNVQANEKVLNEFGISTRDFQGKFIGVESVLHNTAKEFERFNEEQKSSLTYLITGKRRVTELTSVLNNFASAEQLASDAMLSTGSATRKQNEQLDTLASAINSSSAAFTQLSKSLGDAGIESVLKNSTNVTTGLIRTIDLLVSGLNNIAPGILPTVAAFGALKLAGTVIPSIKGALTGLSNEFGVLGGISGSQLKSLAANLDLVKERVAATEDAAYRFKSAQALPGITNTKITKEGGFEINQGKGIRVITGEDLTSAAKLQVALKEIDNQTITYKSELAASLFYLKQQVVAQLIKVEQGQKQNTLTAAQLVKEEEILATMTTQYNTAAAIANKMQLELDISQSTANAIRAEANAMKDVNDKATSFSNKLIRIGTVVAGITTATGLFSEHLAEAGGKARLVSDAVGAAAQGAGVYAGLAVLAPELAIVVGLLTAGAGILGAWNKHSAEVAKKFELQASILQTVRSINNDINQGIRDQSKGGPRSIALIKETEGFKELVDKINNALTQLRDKGEKVEIFSKQLIEQQLSEAIQNGARDAASQTLTLFSKGTLEHARQQLQETFKSSVDLNDIFGREAFTKLLSSKEEVASPVIFTPFEKTIQEQIPKNPTVTNLKETIDQLTKQAKGLSGDEFNSINVAINNLVKAQNDLQLAGIQTANSFQAIAEASKQYDSSLTNSEVLTLQLEEAIRTLVSQPDFVSNLENYSAGLAELQKRLAEAKDAGKIGVSAIDEFNKKLENLQKISANNKDLLDFNINIAEIKEFINVTASGARILSDAQQRELEFTNKNNESKLRSIAINRELNRNIDEATKEENKLDSALVGLSQISGDSELIKLTETIRNISESFNRIKSDDLNTNIAGVERLSSRIATIDKLMAEIDARGGVKGDGAEQVRKQLEETRKNLRAILGQAQDKIQNKTGAIKIDQEHTVQQIKDAFEIASNEAKIELNVAQIKFDRVKLASDLKIAATEASQSVKSIQLDLLSDKSIEDFILKRRNLFKTDEINKGLDVQLAKSKARYDFEVSSIKELSDLKKKQIQEQYASETETAKKSAEANLAQLDALIAKNRSENGDNNEFGKDLLTKRNAAQSDLDKALATATKNKTEALGKIEIDSARSTIEKRLQLEKGNTEQIAASYKEAAQTAIDFRAAVEETNKSIVSKLQEVSQAQQTINSDFRALSNAIADFNKQLVDARFAALNAANATQQFVSGLSFTQQIASLNSFLTDNLRQIGGNERNILEIRKSVSDEAITIYKTELDRLRSLGQQGFTSDLQSLLQQRLGKAIAEGIAAGQISASSVSGIVNPALSQSVLQGAKGLADTGDRRALDAIEKTGLSLLGETGNTKTIQDQLLVEAKTSNQNSIKIAQLNSDGVITARAQLESAKAQLVIENDQLSSLYGLLAGQKEQLFQAEQGTQRLESALKTSIRELSTLQSARYTEQSFQNGEATTNAVQSSQGLLTSNGGVPGTNSAVTNGQYNRTTQSRLDQQYKAYQDTIKVQIDSNVKNNLDINTDELAAILKKSGASQSQSDAMAKSLARSIESQINRGQMSPSDMLNYYNAPVN